MNEKQLNDLREEMSCVYYDCMYEIRNAKSVEQVYKAYFMFEGAMTALRCVNMDFYDKLNGAYRIYSKEILRKIKKHFGENCVDSILLLK